MRKEELYLRIERVLDEWDPIGILQDFKPLSYIEGAIGEYTGYIKPVMKAYLTTGSTKDFLVELQTELRDYPNKEQMLAIKATSLELDRILSTINIKFLRECQ